MSRVKDYISKNKEAMSAKTAKIGSYNFVMTLVMLCILIAVNIIVSLLPTKWTQFDISATRLYSITSSTKSVIQNLEDDVTIYWISQSGQEDDVIEKLLNVYKDESSRITVEKINPDVFPTFAAQYTDEDVYNNSLIVVCGERYRYIPYDSIYVVDDEGYDYYSYSASYSFDGEGCITTAIDYVTREDLPKVYTTTGHGEAELSSSFESAISKQNIETEDISFLTNDTVPTDANAVVINSPDNDFSEEEITILKQYLKDGGKLFVLTGPQESETLDNLNGLLSDYGVTRTDGIVIEGNEDHYAFNMPYVLLPELGDSDITEALSENRSYVVIPIAQGYKTSYASGVTVTELLTTTDESYSKVKGYAVNTYEYEDGDVYGPFHVAFTVEDSGTGAEIVWIGSDNLTDDMYNSYSAGANTDFAMNGLSWLIGETDAISIRSKSLDYDYLTITDSQASTLKLYMIWLLPLAFLAFGIVEVISRRKKK